MDSDPCPSTSGYRADARSHLRKRNTLGPLEIEKELYRLDNLCADSDNSCSESEEELLYEKPIGVWQLLEEVQGGERALEEEVDDPHIRIDISGDDDDDDDYHMPLDIKSFILESDDSVLEDRRKERTRGRPVRRISLRSSRRARMRRGSEPRD